MKKKLKLLTLAVLLFVVTSYFIPSTQKDFFKHYNLKDEASISLKKFQARSVKSVKVNGQDWKYYVGGKGKKTILFLHGMGGAYDLWWQQIKYFENDYRVISYSLPENVNSLEKAKKGILKILEVEKIDTFYGVGTSMGGYILQYLVQEVPNKVEKAVFGNTFPVNNIITTKNKKKSQIIPWLPEILISKLGEKQLNAKLVPAAKNSKLLAAFLPSLPFSKKQFINRYQVIINPFAIKNNYDIERIPKLIIESDNDPLVEKILRKNLKKTYPKAKIHTFHNEGHFPYINAASKYNNTLALFFNEENDFVEIEKTVNNYFEGRKTANIDLLKVSFSKNALLHTVKNNENFKITLEDYLKKVRSDGIQKPKTTIIDGSVINNIANFQTSFDYDKISYVDYLTLMKINGSWQIIEKTFTKI